MAYPTNTGASVEEATDSLLLELALEGDYRVQGNNWDGFDVYASGDRYVRTTVESGSYHVFGFTGWNLDWSIDFSMNAPRHVIANTVRTAYGMLI